MVKEVKMTAKELLEKLIGEGLPPEGWGRWVWKASDGYGAPQRRGAGDQG